MSAAAVETGYEETVEPAGLLKQQVAERLAAHRAKRRGGETQRVVTLEESASPPRTRTIASAVAERYAQSPSYRAFLAAEAEEATRKARAVAEVAARTAEAVAAVQQELLEELEVAASFTEVTYPEAAYEPKPSVAQISRAGLSVRLFEDTGRLSRGSVEEFQSRGNAVVEDFEETRALDEEISFRQSPTFELERPSEAIPGNLLEFPRQLVATRKARPRYAEGPLQAEAQDGAQLRIFEVEAEQLAAEPAVESAAPEWTSIWLDALAAEPVAEPTAAAAVAVPRLETASVALRVMAAVVDGCLVGMGFVLLASGFAWRAAILPSLGAAALGSLLGLAVLFVMYQLLFFTFSDATPGMRYARIGLCTFDDENPTRRAMRRRIAAVALAGLPLGLGFLWALVDDDGVGWHDRMSRMYQRGY